jgi:glycosyltransferase involved in cell wall biosynthesis
MASGLPVISTDNGGIPELLDGEAGLMVAERDSEALAVAIERLASEPERGAQLRARGRCRVEEAFAIEPMVQQLMAGMQCGAPASHFKRHVDH